LMTNAKKILIKNLRHLLISISRITKKLSTA